MNSNSLEKVKTLEAIEKEIINCIQSAGNALQELGKDSKQSQKSVENHVNLFLKSVNTVEKKLSAQINYLFEVTSSSGHEGSSYGSSKVAQLAQRRTIHIKQCVDDLDRASEKYAKV